MVHQVLDSIKNNLQDELHTRGLKTEQATLAIKLAGQLIQERFNMVEDYEELSSLFKSKLKLCQSQLIESLKNEYKVSICAILGKQWEMVSFSVASYIIPAVLTEISNKPEIYSANGNTLKLLLKQEKRNRFFFF